jgi:integrase
LAYVTRRSGGWAARWKDANGRWREERLVHASKTEARHYALDQEKKAERQRMGLDPLDGTGDETFADLFIWWWTEYGQRRRSQTIAPFARKNLLPGLGKLRVREVTAAKLEALLNGKADQLAPQSLNHLRSLVHAIYGKAIRRGKWTGTNPASGVERRKVVKGKPQFLQPEEVAGLMVALDPHWRPLFATAVLTGMRKGELLGLRKADVNVKERTILVARSYEADTTKGGHSDLLPVADELVPWLEEAIRRSPSKLVFPRPDGSMHRRDLALDRVLRRALGRAGVVEGYEHRCRRKGCGFLKPDTTAEVGRCPKCNMKLWAKAVPRHVRFHDLRHTTATLLLKAGVPLATVQRVLRHSDPRLTAMTYGHLDVSDMRGGLNALANAAIGNLPVAARRLLPAGGQSVGRPTDALFDAHPASHDVVRRGTALSEVPEMSTPDNAETAGPTPSTDGEAPWGASGRWFKSSRPDHWKAPQLLGIPDGCGAFAFFVAGAAGWTRGGLFARSAVVAARGGGRLTRWTTPRLLPVKRRQSPLPDSPRRGFA